MLLEPQHSGRQLRSAATAPPPHLDRAQLLVDGDQGSCSIGRAVGEAKVLEGGGQLGSGVQDLRFDERLGPLLV